MHVRSELLLASPNISETHSSVSRFSHLKQVGESTPWYEHVTHICIYNLRCGLTQCDIRWQPNQQPALHAEREGVYKKNGLLWRAQAQEVSVLGAA